MNALRGGALGGLVVAANVVRKPVQECCNRPARIAGALIGDTQKTCGDQSTIGKGTC